MARQYYTRGLEHTDYLDDAGDARAGDYLVFDPVAGPVESAEIMDVMIHTEDELNQTEVERFGNIKALGFQSPFTGVPSVCLHPDVNVNQRVVAVRN